MGIYLLVVPGPRSLQSRCGQGRTPTGGCGEEASFRLLVAAGVPWFATVTAASGFTWPSPSVSPLRVHSKDTWLDGPTGGIQVITSRDA